MGEEQFKQYSDVAEITNTPTHHVNAVRWRGPCTNLREPQNLWLLVFPQKWPSPKPSLCQWGNSLLVRLNDFRALLSICVADIGGVVSFMSMAHSSPPKDSRESLSPRRQTQNQCLWVKMATSHLMLVLRPFSQGHVDILSTLAASCISLTVETYMIRGRHGPEVQALVP